MRKKCFTHEFKKGTKFTFFCSKFAWNYETKKFHMQSNQFCWKGYFTKQPFFREIRNSFRIKSSRNTNERNSRPWPCLYPYCPFVRGRGGIPSQYCYSWDRELKWNVNRRFFSRHNSGNVFILLTVMYKSDIKWEKILYILGILYCTVHHKLIT